MNLRRSACFSASVSGGFSRWGAGDTGEFLPSDKLLGDAAAVGERIDHRGSLSWGRYEIDCCRFVAGRLEGNEGVDEAGTTSELEDVLDNVSRFEVARCSGRGGNEYRLVGVDIFS